MSSIDVRRAGSRTVLVTGASAGIGLAVAEALLARGDRVLALQRRPSRLLGRPGFSEVRHDVADFDGTREKLAELLTGVAHVDQVVLNAAIGCEPADLGDTPLDSIKRVMDVNTWANKAILDALFALVTSVGQVIGISSGAAVTGNRGWGAYALSKATFVMLLDLYAAERAETHFCSLAPGIVQTKMQDDLCHLPAEALSKFPSVKRLLLARGTDQMPTAEVAAVRLLAAFDKVRSQPSGAFVNIRDI